jgi:hypothetical protein
MTPRSSACDLVASHRVEALILGGEDVHCSLAMSSLEHDSRRVGCLHVRSTGIVIGTSSSHNKKNQADVVENAHSVELFPDGTVAG